MKRAGGGGMYHEPVLVDRALDFLITDPSGVYLDGTLGGGGHAEAIVQRLGDRGRLIGMDRDEEAVKWCRRRLAPYGRRVEIVHDAFGCIGTRFPGDFFDGLLLDLGVSSHQLDTPDRGFSYLREGPLDCRMDPSSGQAARDVVNTFSSQDLADVLYEYGEERASRKIARAVVEARKQGPLETTSELARVVRRVVPPKWHNKTLSRVFQGLRIFVNEEMEQLRSALEGAYGVLKPGGRMVVISYHSLEDRMVKRFFRGEAPTFQASADARLLPGPVMNVLTKRAVRPSEEEASKNSRSRSARLRAAEKIREEGRPQAERGGIR